MYDGAEFSVRNLNFRPNFVLILIDDSDSKITMNMGYFISTYFGTLNGVAYSGVVSLSNISTSVYVTKGELSSSYYDIYDDGFSYYPSEYTPHISYRYIAIG